MHVILQWTAEETLFCREGKAKTLHAFSCKGVQLLQDSVANGSFYSGITLSESGKYAAGLLHAWFFWKMKRSSNLFEYLDVAAGSLVAFSSFRFVFFAFSTTLPFLVSDVILCKKVRVCLPIYAHCRVRGFIALVFVSRGQSSFIPAPPAVIPNRFIESQTHLKTV